MQTKEEISRQLLTVLSRSRVHKLGNESGRAARSRQLPDTELTSDVLFLLLHLLLQVRQQGLAPLVHGEADGAEVIAGGLQSQRVQGQEPSRGPAVGERAEETPRE